MFQVGEEEDSALPVLDKDKPIEGFLALACTDSSLHLLCLQSGTPLWPSIHLSGGCCRMLAKGGFLLVLTTHADICMFNVVQRRRLLCESVNHLFGRDKIKTIDLINSAVSNIDSNASLNIQSNEPKRKESVDEQIKRKKFEERICNGTNGHNNSISDKTVTTNGFDKSIAVIGKSNLNKPSNISSVNSGNKLQPNCSSPSDKDPSAGMLVL